MVPQHRRRGVRRLASIPAVLTAVASLSLVSACDKVPLLAPTGSVITLFPAAPSVGLNGQVEIVATVIENGVISTPPPQAARTVVRRHQEQQQRWRWRRYAGAERHPRSALRRPSANRAREARSRTPGSRQIHRQRPSDPPRYAFSGGTSGRIENFAVGRPPLRHHHYRQPAESRPGRRPDADQCAGRRHGRQRPARCARQLQRQCRAALRVIGGH